MTEILSLPDEILDKILSYLTYDEVAHLRLVCRKFDASGKRILNQGFFKAERCHAECLRKFKEQLPRRESERHKHPLSTHCDVLMAMDNRLSLLGMTFMRYIELKYCCFIPGKVLDEIFRVLRFVPTSTGPLRAHSILQELRDLSTMAMEHFDEEIAPAFRIRENVGPKLKVRFHGTSHRYISAAFDESVKNLGCKYELIKLYVALRHGNNKILELKRENTELKRKHAENCRKLNENSRRIAVLENIFSEQNFKISDQDGKIAELDRKLKTYERAISETVNTLLHLKEGNHIVSAILDTYLGDAAIVREPETESTTDDASSGPSNQKKRKSGGSEHGKKAKRTCNSTAKKD